MSNIIQHDSTTATEAHTRRYSSTVAKAARIADVASRADDSGAHVWSIQCDGMHNPLHNDARDVVTVFTDGPGFLLLVDHMQLTVMDTDHGNVNAVGLVGLLDLPVVVVAGRTQAVAAGLVIA